ncbi:DapH/DapD/GlmU-related protein [Flexithrix dorotheae]|uniref:DapH/DapD/GlmU-related protein n=1 Tax=Flexithrix dorotheae TaxID=70993 RepID=UPI000367CF9B|nr:DapH/DapD/GlmU-related protein [Flexithrix dorotheae]
MENNIYIEDFISALPELLIIEQNLTPWELTSKLNKIIEQILPRLGTEYKITDGIAIHKSIVVENGVTFKRPFIAMGNCFIGANAYFREGVILGKSVKIGPSSEIKSSIICAKTAIAHLNYIGNSIIGQNVNFEAGSIAANHYNEKKDKRIRVKYKNKVIDTGIEKFGGLIGDNSRIGANAVLSPGTILEKGSIVKRLELIQQIPD